MLFIATWPEICSRVNTDRRTGFVINRWKAGLGWNSVIS